MTQGQRQRNILDYLEEKGEIIVEDACKFCNASAATIRRDFNELVESGFAEKTWGGIMKRGKAVSSEAMVSLSLRKEQFVKEKQRIAAAASMLVEDGDVIIIDGGSTTYYMASHIANKKIRVITNSIIIAHQIDKDKQSKQGAEVFLTGGMLYPDSGLLVGPQTNQSLRNYNARLAFLSAGALDESGPTNSNQLVVETEQAIIQQSDKIVLLADHSKFGKRNMCRVCSWAEIDYLITDTNKASESTLSTLEKDLQIIMV